MRLMSSLRRAVAARSLLLAVAAVATLSAVGACGSDEPDRVTAKDCERLRDHMVELRMASVTADHDQHRAAIRAALGDFVATCPEAMSVDQLRCSLGAKDFQALAACDPASATAPAAGVAP